VVTNRRTIKAAIFLVVCIATLLLSLSTWGWRLVDFLVWKCMIAFKLPVKPVDDYRIVVDKSEHQLTLYQGERAVRTWPVAISRYGTAPRHRYDDFLTPEGEFLIASMQYRSHFGPRQMLLETTSQALADYRAHYGDEAAALLQEWEARHGPLDTIWEVYDYNAAHPGREIWHDILIHGGGSNPDWTLGCIALNDEDILELFALLQRSRHRGIGVPVVITP